MTAATALSRASEYAGGIRNPRGALVRGTRWAVVAGGPKRFWLYAAGCGPDRHMPGDMNITTWSGTIARLFQQVDEARADNWLTFYEHRLLSDALYWAVL